MDSEQNNNRQNQQLIKLHAVPCLNQKNALWRQLSQNAHKTDPSEPNIPKKMSYSEQDLDAITPIRRKKQKSVTISNFLKHLQVEVQTKDERLETQSQIVSIMDIRYNDSFYSQKRNILTKSVLSDSKFQLILILSSVKQMFSNLRAYTVSVSENYRKELQILSQNLKLLTKSYQQCLSQKILQIKSLQVQLRDEQLSWLQQNHIKASKLATQQSELKYLLQKITTLEELYRKERDNNTVLKNHNIELSDMLGKCLQKNQTIQKKYWKIKQECEERVSKEVAKVQEKFQKLYKQQVQNFQLRVENNRMLYQNYISGWSRGNLTPLSSEEISKISDIGSVELCESFSGSKIEQQISANQQKSNRTTVNNRGQVTVKIEKLKLNQTNCSPKSNSSFRRFARTSNAPQFELGAKAHEKQKSNNSKQTLNKIQSPLIPKFVPEKYNRLSHNSDKTQSVLTKDHNIKNQNHRSSQPELEKVRKTSTKSSFQPINSQIYQFSAPSYKIDNLQNKDKVNYQKYSIQISRISEPINQSQLNQIKQEPINFKNPINSKLNIKNIANGAMGNASRKLRDNYKDKVQTGIKNLGSCYNLGSTFETFNSLSIQDSHTIGKSQGNLEIEDTSFGKEKRNAVKKNNGSKNDSEDSTNKNYAQADRKLRQTVA